MRVHKCVSVTAQACVCFLGLFLHRAFEVKFLIQGTQINPGTLSPLCNLMRVSTSHRLPQLNGTDKCRLTLLHAQLMAMPCVSVNDPIVVKSWIY